MFYPWLDFSIRKVIVYDFARFSSSGLVCSKFFSNFSARFLSSLQFHFNVIYLNAIWPTNVHAAHSCPFTVLKNFLLTFGS